MVDPAGRLDILLTRIVDRMVEQQKNPVVTALYETFKPVLHEEIRSACEKNEFARLARKVFGNPARSSKTRAAVSGARKQKPKPKKVVLSPARGPRKKKPEKETIIDAEFEMLS